MNILLVSDDANYANDLVSKLVFLRQRDAIHLTSYADAVENLSKTKVVLIHENIQRQATIDLIKTLRIDENLCIILLTTSSDENLILSAYDAGINDFVSAYAQDYELVVRIVNNVKHFSFKNSVKRNEKILEYLGIINEETGIYNYNIRVFEEYLNDLKGAIIAIKPKRCTKAFVRKFSDSVKTILRASDFVMYGRNNVFYIVLSDTEVDGGLVVLDKLKASFDEKTRIFAGIASVCQNNIERTESKVLELLSEACTKDLDYVVEVKENDNLDEWLEDTNTKNYKLFNQIFNKKIEKVINPVFYRLQKDYEEKFPKIKIEQYIEDYTCVFKLKCKKQKSTFKIIYPGFAKLLVKIIHDGLDSPENDEIPIPLAKISQKELENIIGKFVQDYITYVGDKNAR